MPGLTATLTTSISSAARVRQSEFIAALLAEYGPHAYIPFKLAPELTKMTLPFDSRKAGRAA